METDKIIPDNWREIIRGKKVILYNTGVSGVLNNREKQLAKMKWVFQMFKERHEVVLWWRPHPLEYSTVHSMLPALEEQYLEQRRAYQEENIGILDESADLHRAIAISDAYYGDCSSVVQLYKAAGKPVMYEAAYIKTRENQPTAFVPASLCEKNDGIWFIQTDSNKLIRLNKETDEIDKIISIPCEPAYQYRVIYRMIDIGQSLLLLFGNSMQIYEYEIGKDIIKIHRPHGEKFFFYYSLVIKNDGKLLMFPYGGSDIWEYNYCTDAITAKKFADKKVWISACYENVKSKVYMVDSGSNKIYKYDLKNGGYEAAYVGNEENKYWGIKKAGSYFVMPCIDKNMIVLWNEKTGEVRELTGFPNEYQCSGETGVSAFLDMVERNGKLYIFPSYANMILRIDVENKTIDQVFDEISFKADYDAGSEAFSGQTYICLEKKQQNVYVYSLHQKCWQIFDLDAMKKQESFLFDIKKEEHRAALKTLWDNHILRNTFCEWEGTEIRTLENYIKNLCNNSAGNNREDTCWESIGKDIHTRIMKEL